MKDRIELLQIVARHIKGARCAEVGVYRGAYSAKIIEHLQPSELLLVDPWKKFSPETYPDYGELTAEGWDRIHQRVVDRFKGYPAVRVIRSLSVSAAATVPDGYLDFVYIDANHSYECVREDIRVWFPKVRSGGFIGGHDVDQKQVAQAVNDSALAGCGVQITSKSGIRSYLARKP